tara:strand:+ start:17 stop:595 length:579 start_codon:yes stop_codon:yes gene_type:complete
MGLRKKLVKATKDKLEEKLRKRGPVITPKQVHKIIQSHVGSEVKRTKKGKLVPRTVERRSPGQRRIRDIKKFFQMSDKEMMDPKKIGQDLRNRDMMDTEIVRRAVKNPGVSFRKSTRADRRFGSKYSAIGNVETREKILTAAVVRRMKMREAAEKQAKKEANLRAKPTRPADETKGPTISRTPKRESDKRKK